MDSTEDTGPTVDHFEEFDAAAHRDDSGCVRLPFDPKEQSATETVLLAVAAASKTDPETLPLLYDVVETGALSSLFDPSVGGPTDPSVVVSFEFAGYDITVHGRGTVTVQ